MQSVYRVTQSVNEGQVTSLPPNCATQTSGCPWPLPRSLHMSQVLHLRFHLRGAVQLRSTAKCLGFLTDIETQHLVVGRATGRPGAHRF